MYFHTVRCPLRATGASPGQGRVVPRGAPGPVGAEGSRDVRNETGKTVPRCFVKLISDLSEADRSEIQLDVVDVSPGSRPFFEESTPAADFGPPLES